MHVTLHEDPSLDDVRITVETPVIDERTARIVGALNAFDRRLAGELDGRTFLYTHDRVLQSPLHLYELEEHLAGTEFVRASRQALVNFDHVRSLRPALGARMVLTLSNGEDVLVSRQYASAIKKKLAL